ncbi:uncharacterized protein ACBR49_001184 [Aulostomus maculatus]
MGSEEMDVESLEKSSRRRGGCLDVFLIVSILVLFALVSALTVGQVMVVKELLSRMGSLPPPSEFGASTFIGATSGPAHRMQNFAFLEATSSELNNSTMSWAPVFYGAGKSVGSNFVFDEAHHSLKPKRQGTYFMYVQLNLTCTFMCSTGLLTVRLGDKLTCEVELSADSTRASRKCWTVSWMDAETRLLAQMTIAKEHRENWKLELTGSHLGMFLVD